MDGSFIEAARYAKMLASSLLFAVLDSLSLEVDQDGLFTEAEVDAKLLASSLLFAVLDSIFAILSLQKMPLLVLLTPQSLTNKVSS